MFFKWATLFCSLFNSYNPNTLMSTAYYRTDLYQRRLEEVYNTDPGLVSLLSSVIRDPVESSLSFLSSVA